MRSNLKRLLAVLACCLLVASFAGKGAALETFKIGYIMPLSGTVAQWGEANLRGAQLALDEINNAGGVAGIKLELITADCQSLPATGVSAAERLISRDKVDVLSGSVMSSVTIAIMEVVSKYKIPYIVGTSTAPAITDPNATTKGYLFRTVPTNDLMAGQLARYICGTLSKQSIALVTDVANDWSVTFRTCFMNEMVAFKNVKLVADESMRGGDTDFYAIITKLRTAKPDAIFVNMQINEAINFVRQIKEMKLDTLLFAAQGGSDPAFIKAAGDSANGMIALSFYEPTNINNPVSLRFTNNFYARYKNIDPGLYDAQAYDVIYLIADALGRAKGDKTRFLSELKATDNLQGVIGKTKFDENGQAKKDVLMVRIMDGKKIAI